MKPELEAQLKSYVNFPSPPGVASQIIELAQDPNIDMGKVAKVVGVDPALATKVLRIANSAVYAQRRRSESLRQALVVLGLNATLTLALSFSVVKSLKGGKPVGLNYPHFWRRTLLSATAARALGEATGQTLAEELFLSGLLQDIGMIALDRSVKDLYRDAASRQTDHGAMCEIERSRLGVDHSEVGAWLMRQWNLPERLWSAIERSHVLESHRVIDADDAFNRCVALSGPLADIFFGDRESNADAIQTLAHQVERIFGLDAEGFGRVLERIGALIPETEMIFETDMVADPDAITEHAREILMVRNLAALREVNTLRDTADSLSARASELEAENRRDALTGAFNRAFLDQYLAREFAKAARQGWPISVAFCDLDLFKKINDTYGHQAGDHILQATARILRGNTRDSDIVARYGGEEFVLVLPSTDSSTTTMVCERIVSAFQQARHNIGNVNINVTISIGFATQSPETPYDTVDALLHAADQALYSAKLKGRNRAMRYDLDQQKPVVRFL
ncbi:MAG: GGDEF domain-containing protein [Steroidobacteraceae bacterium]